MGMRVSRNDGKGKKAGKSVGAVGSMHDSKDLTCNEGQVEDLLSEGESTEVESGEDGQAQKPAERKPFAR
jgi:hypothetical protein